MHFTYLLSKSTGKRDSVTREKRSCLAFSLMMRRFAETNGVYLTTVAKQAFDDCLHTQAQLSNTEHCEVEVQSTSERQGSTGTDSDRLIHTMGAAKLLITLLLYALENADLEADCMSVLILL